MLYLPPVTYPTNNEMSVNGTLPMFTAFHYTFEYFLFQEEEIKPNPKRREVPFLAVLKASFQSCWFIRTTHLLGGVNNWVYVQC